jgi:hypothetical protein
MREGWMNDFSFGEKAEEYLKNNSLQNGEFIPFPYCFFEDCFKI